MVFRNTIYTYNPALQPSEVKLRSPMQIQDQSTPLSYLFSQKKPTNTDLKVTYPPHSTIPYTFIGL